MEHSFEEIIPNSSEDRYELEKIKHKIPIKQKKFNELISNAQKIAVPQEGHSPLIHQEHELIDNLHTEISAMETRKKELEDQNTDH